MSVEPPSSGRPTGPPSGPLSGPTRPSPTPPPGDRAPLGPAGGASGADGSGGGPSGPSGPGGPGGPSGPLGPGGTGSGPGEGPDRRWWKSAPRVAVIAAALVAAVTLAVVFTRSDGGTSGSGGEVFLQAAGKSGPDPFTESTAKDSSTPPETPSPTSAGESANVTRAVDGSAPGLYGGTRNVASCDVEKQISALRKAPAKNKAFASVLSVEPSAVPAYLRSLTPVQLRMDTRVTNHGYRDGNPTRYQAVLQSGTAVLVDDRGVPRVRCACGNPLLPPVAQQSTPRRTGDSWSSYRPANVVVVAPAPQVVNIFVVYDPDSGGWFNRHKGDTGEKDKKTDPPANRPSPSVSSPPPALTSPSPCVSAPTDPTDPTATPSGSASPCPSTSSDTPSAPTPQSEPPSSDPPTAPAPNDSLDSPPSSYHAPESGATSPGL
ncbi:DUF6777 domain-containing protein [Streptomyces sp. NPDC050704]|uniref:DUF6777 domain-containing protein n=1 Tax=Streptomyces sp. NPDC050704 TaxID=3157219 RepID=UPI00342F524C